MLHASQRCQPEAIKAESLYIFLNTTNLFHRHSPEQHHYLNPGVSPSLLARWRHLQDPGDNPPIPSTLQAPRQRYPHLYTLCHNALRIKGASSSPKPLPTTLWQLSDLKLPWRQSRGRRRGPDCGERPRGRRVQHHGQSAARPLPARSRASAPRMPFLQAVLMGAKRRLTGGEWRTGGSGLGSTVPIGCAALIAKTLKQTTVAKTSELGYTNRSTPNSPKVELPQVFGHTDETGAAMAEERILAEVGYTSRSPGGSTEPD